VKMTKKRPIFGLFSLFLRANALHFEDCRDAFGPSIERFLSTGEP